MPSRCRRTALGVVRAHLAKVMLIALSVGGLAWTGETRAAQFTLAPTRVHLAAGQVAQTLVLGNEDARDVSFELTFEHWRMDAAGQWVLEPSDDLIVHPQIVTVPARSKAVIRVGTLRTQLIAEEAYRIQMQELPGERDVQGAAVAMLTRISVPVFVQVAKPSLQLGLDQAQLSRDALSLRLSNAGSRYLSPEDARLIVRDAAGKVLHEDSVGVPYLLVGAHIVLSRPLSQAVCRKADSLDLVFPEAGLTQTLSLSGSARTCDG